MYKDKAFLYCVWVHCRGTEGMHAKCIVSGEIIGWWMLDLARSTTSGKLCHLDITRNPTAGGTLLNLVLQ